MATTAIYPGTFDPITMGHIDIARRAAKIFDRVILAVYDTPAKTLVFSTPERVGMAERALHDVPNLGVQTFNGLLVDFARQVRAGVIVRGLRAVSDYEIETQMALMNRKMAPEVEEVFLVASLIKEIVKLGGPSEGLVPDFVADALRQKFAKQGEAASVPRWLTG